jgi:hypothetical protein
MILSFGATVWKSIDFDESIILIVLNFKHIGGL